MEHRIKSGLFIFLLAALSLPLLQHCFSLIPGVRLYGAYTTSPDVTFTPGKWLDGSYWHAKSKYLNDAVGLRPLMINVNNQVDHSLYHKSTANLVVGKNNCLFFWSFIQVYSGQDYLGWNRIHETVRKLKAVQDTLARLGKTLVLVHAPCKAFFYPEDLPAGYQNPKHRPTNYTAYVSLADSCGVNQVDFNAWFISMKNKSQDLLFTKQGIHWSAYGAMLGADSLVKYLENKRHISMPHPVWSRVAHTQIPRYSDDDIAKCFNLLFPYTHETFSYPEVSYPARPGMVMPRVLYIGDSFHALWIKYHFMDNTNADWRFWYYFREVWGRTEQDDEKEKAVLKGDDWLWGVNHSDCIVMMYSASNLTNLGNGFIERAYDYYYPPSKPK